MVYGRYNELVNRGFVMVYKPTYNWGAPHCKYSQKWYDLIIYNVWYDMIWCLYNDYNLYIYI